MGERYVLTKTVYGSAAVFDVEADEVAPFISEADAWNGLRECQAGRGDIYAWRPPYEEERR